MDMVAGLGGMMGQLAVGIAGGVNGDTGAVMAKMQGLAKTKSTIDSLPDKVICKMLCHKFCFNQVILRICDKYSKSCYYNYFRYC